MPDAVVYLVRHGTHDWLRPGMDRFAGTLPGIGLNAQGREEAGRLRDLLVEVPLMWAVSSPLQRTVETARIILEGRDLAVVEDARLTEWRCVPWEGMLIPEIVARYPEAWRIWHADPTRLSLPDTEPLAAIADRVEAAFREWTAHGGTGLLVSHRDPLAALLCRLLAMPLNRIRTMELPTGSLTEYRLTRHGPVLESINSAGLPE